MPAGSYEAKVAIGESWDVNYGAGGVENGANIAFTSDGVLCSTFSFSATTKVLTVGGTICGASSVADVLQTLLTQVTGVRPGTSLQDKVVLAQTYYAIPDVPATCAALTDFVAQVRAQRGKKLTPVVADELTAIARAIMDAIGCD